MGEFTADPVFFSKKYDKFLSKTVGTQKRKPDDPAGGVMSKESILKIKETEAEADRIVEDARRAAQEMIAAAEREGRELCENTEQEMLAKRAEMLRQIEEKTAQMNERVMEEAKEQSEELKRNVKLRRKAAEKIIIRGLDAKCR